MRVADRHRSMRKAQLLLEVECLMRRGSAEEARSILDDELKRCGHDPDYCLAYANTYVQTDDSLVDPEAD